MDNTAVSEKTSPEPTRREIYRELSIGQLAALLGCNKSLLRYYEEQFALSIPRTKSGRRVYTEREVEEFRYILRLKDGGMSNGEVKSVLSSDRIENYIMAEDEDFDAAIEQASKGMDMGATELCEPEASVNTAMEKLSGVDELAPLLEVIGMLRDEINNLKNLSEYKSKSELLEENERLREKLKEKTYELVDVRERLTQATKKKRNFFKQS